MEKLLHTNNFIRTSSGHYLDVFNPDPSLICIDDIANGLSQVPRFAGQLPVFYSVAQHSVNCCHLAVSAEEKMEFLLHDATEAYLGDLAKPIKDRLPDYQSLEQNLMRVIAKKFKISYPFSPGQKNVDRTVMEQEWKKLIVDRNFMDCWSPEWAKYEFLKTFYKTLAKQNQE